MIAESPSQLLRDNYRCPATGAALRWSGDVATTSDGSVFYPVRDGCPDFRVRRDAPDDAEVVQVRRALASARRVGWSAAIDEVYIPGTKGHTYITQDSRAGFLGLLPMTGDSVVLEIGCSMGQHTAAIAGRCAAVYAIDVVLEQSQFTAARCTQQGIHNVSVACGGDDSRLPYREGMFDVVIMNLVLEWCASRSPEPHHVVHHRMLREIARVTKRGGVLFLTTKNRYSLRLLLGGRDEHAHGLRFGSALPRAVLDRLLRHYKLGRARGWLHSYSELRGLIMHAGFSTPKSFWAAPDMRYPRHYVPTDPQSVRGEIRRSGKELGTGRIYGTLLPRLPARMIKYLTPGLTFVAGRLDE
ncbi:MAG: class I SAM-dependent methyltransferase [Planctomycetes bacterium]|nr:class I SAM-dependent methyltransferase [Planctomycetota bacterium]